MVWAEAGLCADWNGVPPMILCRLCLPLSLPCPKLQPHDRVLVLANSTSCCPQATC